MLGALLDLALGLAAATVGGTDALVPEHHVLLEGGGQARVLVRLVFGSAIKASMKNKHRE